MANTQVYKFLVIVSVEDILEDSDFESQSTEILSVLKKTFINHASELNLVKSLEDPQLFDSEFFGMILQTTDSLSELDECLLSISGILSQKNSILTSMRAYDLESGENQSYQSGEHDSGHIEDVDDIRYRNHTFVSGLILVARANIKIINSREIAELNLKKALDLLNSCPASEYFNSQSSYQLLSSYLPEIIDLLLNLLKDKEWAKKIYKEAEEKAEDCSDFRDLADSIHENLGDKEFAKKVYKKAEKKAEDSEDFCGLADSIHEKLGDKEFAKKVYKKAEKKAEEYSDFSSLGDSIHVSIRDKEWAMSLYKKASEKAEDCSSFIELAESIHDKLGDKKWVKELYIKVEGEAGDSADFRYLADSICQKQGDKKWSKKVYEKAEEKAEDSDDYESLAESVRDNLGDEKWAKLLDQKAEELSEENEDDDDYDEDDD